MTLRVFDDDSAGFSLHDENDVRIGWIQGRIVGFRCFADRRDAIAAAHVAHRAMLSWADRLGVLRAPAKGRDGAVQFVNAGVDEVFVQDGVLVARLVRPRADVEQDRGLYGIELVIPHGIGAVAAIGGAQAVYSELTREMPGAVVHSTEEQDIDTYATGGAPDIAGA